MKTSAPSLRFKVAAALAVLAGALVPLQARAWPHGPGGLPVPVIVPGAVYVPAPVYVPPPVYVAPQVYAPAPVYAPDVYDPYVYNAAPADVIYLNGDTYIWAVDGYGRRYRRFYRHGDYRREVYHRQEMLHREGVRNGGHPPEPGGRGIEHREGPRPEAHAAAPGGAMPAQHQAAAAPAQRAAPAAAAAPAQHAAPAQRAAPEQHK